MGEPDPELSIFEVIDRTRNIRQETTLLIYASKLERKRSAKLREKCQAVAHRLQQIGAKPSDGQKEACASTLGKGNETGFEGVPSPH